MPPPGEGPTRMLKDAGTQALHRAPSPLSFPESPLARIARQPMMIGLFLPTQTGGFSQSKLPRATRWDFEYNKQLTLAAERHGFDFAFGLQQWVGKGGFGGEMKYRENFLDPFISTVALGAVTTKMVTISTVHILYGNWHPLHLARFAATADHITGGRFGLNIVTGYDANEPLMFGMERVDHDERYERADEFSSIMEDLWAGEDNLTYNGRFYRLEGVYVSPHASFGRPIMVSASASPTGFAYAAKHSDIVFTSSPAGAVFENAIGKLPEHVAAIRKAYRETGRTGKVIIFPLIVCKETHAEAMAYRNAIVDNADLESIRAYTARHSAGDAHGWKQHVPADRVMGGHIQIVGDPVEVADQIAQLKEADFDGIQIGFYDYMPDLEFFAANVLPLLKERGLRIA
jgi:FMNH2-dependent dimethyl sulfone monooxygenase